MSACGRAIFAGALLLLGVHGTHAAAADSAVPQRHFDVLIVDGEVVDGSGAPRTRLDIGIVGDRIVAVGRLGGSKADRVVSARGHIVAPGFLDMHAHVADDQAGAAGMFSPDPKHRAVQNYVAQGVTTVLGNPDGAQSIPMKEQRKRLEALGIGVNLALTSGHNGLRDRVLGKNAERPASDEEIAGMRRILADEMEHDGSFGLSLGLEYKTGDSSNLHELVELARVLPAWNGIYIPHLRSQGDSTMFFRPSLGGKPDTLDGSIDETLAVAEQAGATVVFTHMKAWGPGYRGQAARLVARLQAARDRGLAVYMDVYPYDSSGSDGDFVAIPIAADIYGVKNPDGIKNFDYKAAFKRFLAGADARQKDGLATDIRHFVALKGGAQNIVVLDYPDRSYVGKRLSELMAQRKLDEAQMIQALQLEGDAHRAGGAHMRSFSMDDEDIKTFYRQPWTMTSTDGWVVLPEEAVGARKYVDTNRRVFGSYPRRIAYYSQQQGVDTLEEAVRKMTALPAQVLRINDRGRIAPGMKADIAVFDLARLRDNTTYLEPSVYPDGVDYVLVNGRFVVDGGKRTLALPGRVLAPADSHVVP
ncbi:MAG: amidohydrolase family protein [Rudaea sp.]|uniref:N-acyl-D-amino-acid deacylase family protein n=1 Tax=unclassified Rudaea TaxID=2627037 RepID=UPI0010F8BB8A|nr:MULTISPECIES: amidohydrolase family protein [unclassified Rudaea]MBN8886194.1 amidohydrolase family protein [Rudaea sp.]MBR0344640.1 amidohydrolase family protein [Rudaea sp.]